MTQSPATAPFVWQVGALCRAIADALQARFNPVAVRGEISGFTRAASGHCYFTLKDAQGQLRCAMFRRAASQLDFIPQDGESVDLQGRLGVYEPRGELQLIVENLRRTGLGSLFEQFVQRKAKLEALGWFDVARKRALPAQPRGIGLVTSLGAAALHDVATALARRVPHIPVVLAPALVQGVDAPQSLVRALQSLGARQDIDLVLLVRGGGSLEDLWAFNDEALAQAIINSPVPVVCGVGHETDFTIADFCADLRAPTPTAAAELCALPRAQHLQGLVSLQQTMQQAFERQLDRQSQRLDRLQSWLTRPAQALGPARLRLHDCGARLQAGLTHRLSRQTQGLTMLGLRHQSATAQTLQQRRVALERLDLRLSALNPRLVLQRGYAWLSDARDLPVTSVHSIAGGQPLRATLVDGVVELQAQQIHPDAIS